MALSHLPFGSTQFAAVFCLHLTNRAHNLQIRRAEYSVDYCFDPKPQGMANILISDAEKTFILHGVEENLRNDGRTRCDYRPMEIETGIVTHANGSCRLRLANTDVLVAVKAEIDVPPIDNPDEGKITFFVDCSANAAPEFEGRGGEELALEFANTLEGAYRSRQAFNLKNLCILPQQRCWKLFVDVLVRR